MKVLFLLSVFTLFYSTGLQAKEKPPLKPEDFSYLPIVRNVTLSPDGKNMAALSQSKEKPVVYISAFASRKVRPVIGLKNMEDRIEWIRWVSNHQLIIQASYPEVYGKHKFRIKKIHLIDITKNTAIPLINKSVFKKRQQSWENQYEQYFLFDTLKNDHEHVLLRSYDARDKGYPIFKVNLKNGSFKKIISAKDGLDSFYQNSNGEIVYALRHNSSSDNDKLTTELLHRKSAKDDWKIVYETHQIYDNLFKPIGIDPNDKKLLIFTNIGSDYTYIAKFDLHTKSISNPVHQIEKHDINQVLVSNGLVRGYKYIDHYLHTTYLDKKYRKLEKRIRAVFGNKKFEIVSQSDNLKRIVVKTYSDKTPSRYFTVDLHSNQAKLWFSQYPILERKEHPKKEPISYSARDKMKLNAYLSLPELKQKNILPPLIIMPHGGPHARDYRDFDIMTKLFVNQGYAVLQPNFRGSSGYGFKYEKAGYKQWGKAMHDDVMDALTWIKKQGKVNTNKVCMVGSSYGGYEVLVASYKNPESFQCFISIAGISDLQKMLDTDRNWSNIYGASNDLTVGSESDSESLQENSPINYVNKMNKPILLIHGTNDSIVRYQQSETLYRALKSKKKPVKYIELEKGTHFLDYEKNRKLAFKQMIGFLNEHLR